MLQQGWRPGRSDAWLEKIPEEERCEHCSGTGEAMLQHQFIGGYSYQPCSFCWGDGRKEKAKEE